MWKCFLFFFFFIIIQDDKKVKVCNIIVLHLELFESWMGILWFYSVFFFSTLQGPLMCVRFRNVRMHRKGFSCLLLCLCSLSSRPHSQMSPVRCYKTSKGLFNVWSRLLCHSRVSEWGATRHRRRCTPCPLTHTSSGCVLVVKSTAATAVPPRLSAPPFSACRQSTHTRC